MRKDPSADYVYLVAACKNCNYAKRKLSYDEFIDLAKRIVNNLKANYKNE